MNIMTPIAEAGYGTINTKRNASWSSGDYRKFGVTLQITGEELAEAAEVAPGSTVLDVAAGNGNATLAFARRWCSVTSTDHVKNLLRAGRMRAEAEGLDVEFQVADAEDLPFEDGQFDAVVSSFGVMFAPNQQRAASEMLRVCRSGGIVAMASWTPESFIGALLRTVSRHILPPAGAPSPARWGDASWIDDTFAAHATSINTRIKPFRYRYPSPRHFLDFFRAYYGPVHKAYEALDERAQAALSNDITATISKFDTSQDGSMDIESDYAEVVLVKR